MFAAKIIVAVENPEDVIAISARPYGQRAVLKYANYTGATAIAGRFTPGTFTNQITKGFKEPRLLIITDPRTDSDDSSGKTLFINRYYTSRVKKHKVAKNPASVTALAP